MKLFRKAILPLGFKASGLACGVKKSGKLDLALFYSEFPAKGACLFTTNKIQAAPVKVSKDHLRLTRSFQAIIANSGNANCFTGRQGFLDAQAMARAAADALSLRKENILVNSTGVIGKKLPIEKIASAIPALVKGLSRQGIDKAKKAILTTDLFVKEVCVRVNIANKPVTICGVAKGAGMIAPNMATMLAFILTDAHIGRDALNKALTVAVNESFNCITVDGCMSTNDSVMVLANAAAANKAIVGGRDLEIFTQALNLVCLELAKMVVRDAEGASKFIKITVDKAKSDHEAKRAALGIANSNLFKTAIFGENPNFGRIVAGIGASGVAVSEEGLRMKVSPLKKKEIHVKVSLGEGKGSATVYTSDLTPEYIRINAEYN
jgi:glutamate N-acetyltransferase/amino-acid N-acetyltransferase